MPVFVICCRFLPSRSIMKICALPARVDVNATCRPLGENAGLSLLPIPSVIVRVCRGREVEDPDVEAGAGRDAYAISLNGAGDQVGRSHHVSFVILSQLRAVGVHDQICGVPVRSESNAIWVPGRRPGRRDVDLGIVRQPPQPGAVAIDDVDLRVAVAVRRERELRAVGRPGRQLVLFSEVPFGRLLAGMPVTIVLDDDVRKPLRYEV